MTGLLDTGRSLRRFWRGVTGADAYERYCAHLARVHPGARIPSEREFWRAKYDEMDRNPTSRCC
ncbi:MAG: YbdD/YjiX family protein [Actinobacteria bacterium]|uniref:YbdD/YjiX family protein n=1 Tax=Nostocoides veronense TaxID=330836 RepID=A0ABN2LIK5_9MICO|nr:YbdD/YjiX family protein [Actinomycetota bacterium]